MTILAPLLYQVNNQGPVTILTGLIITTLAGLILLVIMVLAFNRRQQ